MTKETANSEFWPDGVRLVISISEIARYALESRLTLRESETI
jgi:hypothetical protein